MIRARRRLLAAVLATSTILLGACSTLTGSDDVPLIAASVAADRDDVLDLQFSGCDGDPRITVTETAEEVRVRIHGPNTGCEPLHHTTVQLDAPLGDRIVIDNATGDQAPDVG